MIPRVPELLVVMLGTWRAGAIYQSLFTAFGPAAIEARIIGASSSEAKLIVTDSANRPKLDEVPNCPPVLVLKRNGQTRPGDGDFNSEMDARRPEFEPVARRGDEPFGVIFTSDTTGRAKGVAYPLSALLQFAVFMRDGVDLRPDDIYVTDAATPRVTTRADARNSAQCVTGARSCLDGKCES
jgi:acetyl-CoA synthetase